MKVNARVTSQNLPHLFGLAGGAVVENDVSSALVAALFGLQIRISREGPWKTWHLLASIVLSSVSCCRGYGPKMSSILSPPVPSGLLDPPLEPARLGLGFQPLAAVLGD